jgi:serine/threonine-protein kinase RsbT
MEERKQIAVSSDLDIVIARREGRSLAEKIGFTSSDLTVIATAISEIARNIVEYAKKGKIIISEIKDKEKQGIQVVARDRGPGISDVERAMQDGFTTGKGLGLGLPGTRRIMDEFEITSKAGKGTTVTIKKWLKRWNE